MRNIVLSIFACACVQSAMAQQPEVGTVSIIPRIGLSIANLPGDNVFVGVSDVTNMPFSPRYKAGFTGGIDIDWQFSNDFSLMVGAHYAQQGCSYSNNSIETSTSGANKTGTGYSDWSTQLNYINVPLVLNAYIAPGFALKAGFQAGFAVSGKMKYTSTDYTVDKNGDCTFSSPKDVEYNLNSTMKKVCFSIPVGFSYEFSDVLIDARYNIGLTPFQQIGDYKGSKNRVFTVSAGYRFTL